MNDKEVRRTLFEQRRKMMIEFITTMKFEDDPHYVFIGKHSCDSKESVSLLKGCNGFVLDCASSLGAMALGIDITPDFDN